MCIYPISHCWTRVMTVLWFLPVSVSLTLPDVSRCLAGFLTHMGTNPTRGLFIEQKKQQKKRKSNKLQILHMHTRSFFSPLIAPSMSLRTSRPMRTFFLLESHPHPGLGGGRAAINLHLLSHSSPRSGFHVFPFPSLHLFNLTSALLFLHRTTHSFFFFLFSSVQTSSDG